MAWRRVDEPLVPVHAEAGAAQRRALVRRRDAVHGRLQGLEAWAQAE